jgi:hypothetical protein
MWIIVKYAKRDAADGDIHLNVDTSGAYTNGILATQDTTAQDEWLLTGKQQRRGPVRQDFTGGGMLVQNIATGVIATKAPVAVPGI